MNARNNQNLTDEQLLNSWKKGDVNAYDALFYRYYESLFKYVCFSINNKVLSEELVMDVMTRVWQNGQNITTPPGFKAYLLRAIKNAVINYYRKDKPVTISIDGLSDFLSESEYTQVIGHYEIEENYKEALSSLSERKREVFLLSREYNLTYKEIARKLKISVNTVENYMSASIAELRKKIKNTQV